VNLNPYTPVPRYAPGETPKHSRPVEVVRANGCVHYAVFHGGLWREADRTTQTLDTLDNGVAFWRDAE
jgi:hypothetical protein